MSMVFLSRPSDDTASADAYQLCSFDAMLAPIAGG
jgi:hypothetical protein